MGQWLVRIVLYEVAAIVGVIPLMIALNTILPFGMLPTLAIGMAIHYAIFFGLIIYSVDWDAKHDFVSSNSNSTD